MTSSLVAAALSGTGWCVFPERDAALIQGGQLLLDHVAYAWGGGLRPAMNLVRFMDLPPDLVAAIEALPAAALPPYFDFLAGLMRRVSPLTHDARLCVLGGCNSGAATATLPASSSVRARCSKCVCVKSLCMNTLQTYLCPSQLFIVFIQGVTTCKIRNVVMTARHQPMPVLFHLQG